MNCNALLSAKVLKNSFICLIFLPQLSEARLLPDFTHLVEENTGAVVNISTSINEDEHIKQFNENNFHNIPEGSPLYDFFNNLPKLPENTLPRLKRTSLGSGFIVSTDGYIITNSHVIKNALEIIVRFNDRREFVAELIGTDKRSDIALLKVDVKNLPTLSLGDSSELKIGEWVLAIGSPFGFEHSVTQGIVSAMGRSLPNGNYVPFIQTDVAINPGNSGGPLFNLKGEVIGVNSQIYSFTGSFTGMSFAIPVNVVKNVYHQLRDNGRVSRGWLGVLIHDVTSELAKSFSMGKPHGALIAKVVKGSPAEEAGLMVSDIILSFDGEKIAVSSDLPPMVGITEVGQNVPLKIFRRGRIISLDIKISEMIDEDIVITEENINKKDNLLSVFVEDLNKEQRNQLNIDYGIIINRVLKGPAYQAGVKDNDIILLLNNIKVKNVKHFEELIDQLPKNKSFPLLIHRQGNSIFLALKLE